MIEQLEQAGAPPEVIAAARKQANPEADVVEVWPENWESFTLFSSLSTQWVVAVGVSAARRIGLNYPAAESVMRMMNIPRKRQSALLGDLRVMERAALKVWNKDD